MKTKHSPGSWKVRKQAKRFGRETGYCVLDRDGCAKGANLSEDDATLIAAAPEMLTALRLVWASIDRVNHPASEAVKSAIAKAEGQKE